MSARRRFIVAIFTRRAAASCRDATRPASLSALTVLARSRNCVSSSFLSSALSSKSRYLSSASFLNSISSSSSSTFFSSSSTCFVSRSLSCSRSMLFFSSSSFRSFRSSSSSLRRSSVSRESWLPASSPSPGSSSPAARAASISALRFSSSSFLVPRSMPARAKVFFVATLASLGYTGKPQFPHSTHLGTVRGSGSMPSGDCCTSTYCCRSSLALFTRAPAMLLPCAAA
mmetsp:Transcript_100896/g.325705  ORF Transcript_100896/g.325705 Transcript_100896/m.325705 type:complete len:229 (+) Transcript_100896:669-1355(+)